MRGVVLLFLLGPPYLWVVDYNLPINRTPSWLGHMTAAQKGAK